MIENILLYGQKIKEEDLDLVKSIKDELFNSGFKVFYLEENVEVFSQCICKKMIALAQADVDHKKIHLVLSLGGDGTMLKAVSVLRDHGIPLIGINLGRLGFLSTIEKAKVSTAIAKIKNGKYRIEERSMLKLRSNVPMFDKTAYALNDFTIHKRETSSMITVHVSIDDRFLTTYWADGIILATPTGSTGYSLACGGPIIYPDSQNFVLTPIAPHNLNVRPLVINDDVKISFEIEGRAENYLCTLDSLYATITEEYKITISKAPDTTKLMVLDGTTFPKTLRDKLLWGIDKRN